MIKTNKYNYESMNVCGLWCVDCRSPYITNVLNVMKQYEKGKKRSITTKQIIQRKFCAPAHQHSTYNFNRWFSSIYLLCMYVVSV